MKESRKPGSTIFGKSELVTVSCADFCDAPFDSESHGTLGEWLIFSLSHIPKLDP